MSRQKSSCRVFALSVGALLFAQCSLLQVQQPAKIPRIGYVSGSGNASDQGPTKFEFVLNLKTATALQLTIPQSVLFRADKVVK